MSLSNEGTGYRIFEGYLSKVSYIYFSNDLKKLSLSWWRNYANRFSSTQWTLDISKIHITAKNHETTSGKQHGNRKRQKFQMVWNGWSIFVDIQEECLKWLKMIGNSSFTYTNLPTPVIFILIFQNFWHQSFETTEQATGNYKVVRTWHMTSWNNYPDAQKKQKMS